MSHCFIVMEMPYDKDERPIVHGVFEDCYAAMSLFTFVVGQLRNKVAGKHHLAFYSCEGDVARVEVDGGEYDRHTVVVERVAFTRRPEP
jgi:hypothetical protein